MSTADGRPGGRAPRRRGAGAAAPAALVACALAVLPAAAAHGAARNPGDGAVAAPPSAAGTLPAAAADSPLAVTRERGYPAVSGDQLGRTPVGPVRREGGRIVAGGPGGEVIELYPGSPFLRHGGRVYQLANPPYVADGRVWVPAELLTRWLPLVRGQAQWELEGARLARADPFAERPFRVIIDPGHGGRDPGAIGPHGHREKSVTLAVARELREALESVPNVEGILTRGRDTLIALQDRSRFALEENGDLFLSLHANASESRRARGFETYFLSPARTEEAREVAMRENASVKYERGSDSPDLNDLQFILADLDQDINVRESSRLAGYAQNAMRPVHSGPDRGVKQAGFLVLVGASGGMPSVLVEIGFLTNPNEARVLTSSQGQEKIAESIADAVVRYFDQYRQRLAGNRSGE